MPIKQVINEGLVPVKIYADEIESSAYKQLLNASKLPIIYHHIAAMPDVHCGIGATVGAVIPTKHAIIPAAVGVDIGCGMMAVKLSLKAPELPDNLKSLRFSLEENIPVGFNTHNDDFIRQGACQKLSKGLQSILIKHPNILKYSKNLHHTWRNQLGTLGGGNHFVEICLDENQNVWIMLHSGSRGIGNAIGKYFIELAKKDMGTYLHHLPDKDLAYLNEGTVHFTDYFQALLWAQNYAFINRQEMMSIVMDVLRSYLPSFKILEEAINCHHNYVALENHYGEEVYITRKGAIRAQSGDLGIIPGSMGTPSFIVRGRGAKEAFYSCAHGAGRVMSRQQAKKKFNVKDLILQTQGVECRKDHQVLDEIPHAYKNINTVMENQNDLVEVLYQLKQIVCIKG